MHSRKVFLACHPFLFFHRDQVKRSKCSTVSNPDPNVFVLIGLSCLRIHKQIGNAYLASDPEGQTRHPIRKSFELSVL